MLTEKTLVEHADAVTTAAVGALSARDLDDPHDSVALVLIAAASVAYCQGFSRGEVEDMMRRAVPMMLARYDELDARWDGAEDTEDGRQALELFAKQCAKAVAQTEGTER